MLVGIGGRQRQLADEVGDDPVRDVRVNLAEPLDRRTDREEHVDLPAHPGIREPYARRDHRPLRGAVVLEGMAHALERRRAAADAALVEEPLGRAEDPVVVQREHQGGAGAASERQEGVDQPVVRVHDVGSGLAQQPPQPRRRPRVGQRRRVAPLLQHREAGDAVHRALEQLDPHAVAPRRLSQRLGQGGHGHLVAPAGQLAAEVLDHPLLSPDHRGVGLRQHQDSHRAPSYSRPNASPPSNPGCNLTRVPGPSNQEGNSSPPSISVIVTAFTFDRLPSIEEIIESLRDADGRPARDRCW